MYCPKCDKEFDSKFCPDCGTKLVERVTIMYCPNCNKECNSKFCPDCGAKAVSKTSVASPAPKAVSELPEPPAPVVNKDRENEALALYKKGKEYIDLFLDSKNSNYPIAEYCFKRAAELGYVKAQMELAWLYNPSNKKVVGLEQGLPKAKLWYEKAADQGHVDALMTLVDIYWQHDSDLVKAAQTMLKVSSLTDEENLFEDVGYPSPFYEDMVELAKQLWDKGEPLSVDLFQVVANTECADNESIREEAQEFLKNHGKGW